MDRATIEFNYSSALQQASNLESTSSKIKTLADVSIKDNMHSLSGFWEGENSKKYISKGNTLANKIAQTASGINTVAATIRTIAKQIYDAEMEALRIEEERAYRARLAAEEAERKAREAEAKEKKFSNNHFSGGGGGGGGGRGR